MEPGRPGLSLCRPRRPPQDVQGVRRINPRSSSACGAGRWAKKTPPVVSPAVAKNGGSSPGVWPTRVRPRRLVGRRRRPRAARPGEAAIPSGSPRPARAGPSVPRAGSRRSPQKST